jgi:1-acyl-sn-glycerol-3-phosphate acyltransferase
MPLWVRNLYYDIAYMVCFWLMIVATSVRMTGRRNMPMSGPVLLLANHTSFIDPLLIGFGSRRRLSFLARVTLFHNRYFRALINSVNAIPINHRGFSREGLQAVLDALAKGQAVVMFPEGERSADGKLAEFKPGLALLVKRSKALIVPVGIAGAFAAWPRQRKLPRFNPLFQPPTKRTLAVAIGKPIDPAKYANVSREEMLADLQRAVQVEMVNAEMIRRQKRNHD